MLDNVGYIQIDSDHVRPWRNFSRSRSLDCWQRLHQLVRRLTERWGRFAKYLGSSRGPSASNFDPISRFIVFPNEYVYIYTYHTIPYHTIPYHAIQTYIQHTVLQTYRYTGIQTYMRTCIHAYIHTHASIWWLMAIIPRKQSESRHMLLMLPSAAGRLRRIWSSWKKSWKRWWKKSWQPVGPTKASWRRTWDGEGMLMAALLGLVLGVLWSGVVNSATAMVPTDHLSQDCEKAVEQAMTCQVKMNQYAFDLKHLKLICKIQHGLRHGLGNYGRSSLVKITLQNSSLGFQTRTFDHGNFRGAFLLIASCTKFS